MDPAVRDGLMTIIRAVEAMVLSGEREVPQRRRRSRRAWTIGEEELLASMRGSGRSYGAIAIAMGRSTGAVAQKWRGMCGTSRCSAA